MIIYNIKWKYDIDDIDVILGEMEYNKIADFFGIDPYRFDEPMSMCDLYDEVYAMIRYYEENNIDWFAEFADLPTEIEIPDIIKDYLSDDFSYDIESYEVQ